MCSFHWRKKKENCVYFGILWLFLWCINAEYNFFKVLIAKKCLKMLTILFPLFPKFGSSMIYGMVIPLYQLSKVYQISSYHWQIILILYFCKLFWRATVGCSPTQTLRHPQKHGYSYPMVIHRWDPIQNYN